LLSKASQGLSSIDAIKIPVEYVRENFLLKIEKLVKLAFISVSALERRFKSICLKLLNNLSTKLD
jgi:hypothetical protein